MPIILVSVTDNGFHVSDELARQLGLEAGQTARIEIRKAPDSEAIRHAAMRHCWRRLGDAVGAGEPSWENGVWSVPLKVRGRTGTFGQLVLSEDGQIIPERSTSKQELRSRVDASGANPPPPG